MIFIIYLEDHIFGRHIYVNKANWKMFENGGLFYGLIGAEFVAIPLGIEIDENINDLNALVIVTGDIKNIIANKL